MLKNDRGRFMQHHELYPVLAAAGTGIVGSRLPTHGFNVVVRGVRFVCDPSPNLASRSSPHRLKYECRVCNKLVPFGRAGQHVKGRQHQQGILALQDKAAGMLAVYRTARIQPPCKACRDFFTRCRCSAATHLECDCPKCQGYCTCNT